MNNKLLCILFLFWELSAFFPPVNSLPANEYEAESDLEEGTLDSLTWDLLKEFYSNPVHVPLGELKYLSDKMPEINEEDIPSAVELKKYEPWNQKCIDLFFKDYPQLEKYLPVLSFYQKNKKNISGKIAFSGKINPGDTNSTQKCRFTSELLSSASSQGSFHINRDRIQWNRRIITFKLSDYFESSAGNFRIKPGNGLFFGYFPSIPDIKTLSNRENWLYGSYNTWNGLSAVIRPSSWNDLSFFVHKRPAETGGGVKWSFNIKSVFRNYITFSYLNPAENHPHTKHFVQSGFNINIKNIKIYGHSGFSLDAPLLLPFYVTLKNYRNPLRFEGSLFHIPEGFNTSRSRICHSSRYALGIKDTESTSVSGFQISESFIAFGNIKQSIDSRYLISPHNSEFRTNVKFKMENPLYSAAAYGFKITAPGDTASHNFSISFKQNFINAYCISEEISTYLSSNGYKRYSLKLFTELILTENIVIYPHTSFSFFNNRDNRCTFGFKQRTTILENVFFEYRTNFRFTKTTLEDFYIATNTNFIF